ncbi:Ring-h2 finger protein [Thalictrum thalictroides]|uniref:Ring-h2 finger protein n=1 Tax=Thalictrum thalictroides TaxID=46969 RepID=A0A7J6UTF9_THATH|nr:Ring-h2 finger protein [Thalictrum thalictroides]
MIVMICKVLLSPEVIMMGILICMIFLFVGVGFLLLFHFCVGGGPLRWAVFNPGTMIPRRRNTCYNMPKVDLEKFPCYDFEAEEKDSNPVVCAICLENLKVGDRCRLLPRCKHSFHSQCIDSWLLKTPSCPICRTSANFNKSCMVSGEGSSHPVDVEFSFRESQQNGDETELSSSPSLPHDTPSEPTV